MTMSFIRLMAYGSWLMAYGQGLTGHKRRKGKVFRLMADGVLVQVKLGLRKKS